MDMLFIKVLNMSISASWLVLLVLSLRFLLKKAPRWIHVALWALVAVRLICPYSPESVFSVMPEKTTERMVESISGGYYGDSMIYSQGSEQYDAAVAAGVAPSVGDNGYRYVVTQSDDPTKPVRAASVLFGQIWVAGIALMALYALASYLRLKRKVAPSVDVGNGVYICDYIDTPFILGILKPKIYLPSSMEPDSASHVLAHERAHIARRDHWWKPFGYLLLAVHWFNPVLWLAYILLCRDIELACDEKVIRDMELPQKKAYSEALLHCSVNRRHIAACPLAFGEVGVKERVRTVLNYKKPAFWIVLMAIMALIVTAVCFLTDPVKTLDATYRVEEVVYRNPAISYYMTEEAAPLFQITEDNTLRVKEWGEDWADLGEFSEIKLSDLNFEELFSGKNLDQIREENQKAWLLSIPPKEGISTLQFYILLLQENGEIYIADGILFQGVYPLHDDVLDAICVVTWLYRLTEADSEQSYETDSNQESPYDWTKNLRTDDVFFCAASLHEGDWSADPVEGTKLAELVALLNQVQEDQFVTKIPAGENDPLWNHNGVHLWISSGRDDHMLLRYVEDTLIISSTTDYGRPNSGYWIIESQELKDWMQNLSYGGADMLSEDNREEIRQLLRMDYVEFFAPQEYDDYLFLGCRWDHDRGLGVACFEKVAYGYKLVRLIRDEDVRQCASGDQLYYCNYNGLRIFLVLNQNITGMEWAGAYENTYAINTHPGLIVEYFPQNLGSMYRFVYGEGKATTMYMDWNNQIYGQVPEDSADTFANPSDAYSVCSKLRLDQVELANATELVEVDERFDQAHSHFLNTDELTELLKLLHALPEDAFEPAEYPEREFRTLDIQLRNYTGIPEVTPLITLRLHEGEVYYRLIYEWSKSCAVYKIHDPELLEYVESFFEGDMSNWERFAPCPKVDGLICGTFDGLEITTLKMSSFEYQVSEDGLRFKPRDQEGWVLLQYGTEPYVADQTGLKTFINPFGSYSKETCITGYYDESEYWSFMDVTVTAGDTVSHIHLINEVLAPWVKEYGDEISRMLLRLDLQATG